MTQVPLDKPVITKKKGLDFVYVDEGTLGKDNLQQYSSTYTIMAAAALQKQFLTKTQATACWEFTSVSDVPCGGVFCHSSCKATQDRGQTRCGNNRATKIENNFRNLREERRFVSVSLETRVKTPFYL